MKANFKIVGFAVLCLHVSNASEPSEFIVASLKPVSPDIPKRYSGGPGFERASWSRTSPRWLIRTAYPDYLDHPERISGPSWLDSDYALEAKMPPGTTQIQFRQMVAGLLVSRFGLAFHEFPKDLDGWVITQASGGHKLASAEAPAFGTDARIANQPPKMDKQGFPVPSLGGAEMTYSDGIAHINLVGASMRVFLGRLGLLFPGVLFQDKTGLAGKYLFRVAFPAPPRPLPPELRNGQSASVGEDGPQMDPKAVAAALEKQLGLKMKAAKVQAQFMVVDKLNKTPTPN